MRAVIKYGAVISAAFLLGIAANKAYRIHQVRTCVSKATKANLDVIMHFYGLFDEEDVYLIGPNHITAYYHFKVLECLKDAAK